VLCDQSITDAETGKVSLIGVIDEFFFPWREDAIEKALKDGEAGERPGIPIVFELITCWRRTEPTVPEKVEVRLVLEAPSGQQLAAPAVTIDLSESWGARTRIRLQTIPMLGLGRYWFFVCTPKGETELEVVARVPLRVRGLPAESANTDGETADNNEAMASTEPEPPSEPTPSAQQE
jgi:hypothetical protein